MFLALRGILTCIEQKDGAMGLPMFPGGRRERAPPTPPLNGVPRPAYVLALEAADPGPKIADFARTWHTSDGGRGASHRLATPASVSCLPAVQDDSVLPRSQSSISLAEKVARVKQAKKADHAKHLRMSPMQMGGTPSLTTTYTFYSSKPVQMANNPMWSTDLKALDNNLRIQNQGEVRLTAATPGSMSPEPKLFVPYMKRAK
eukprot:TRINITY_DN13029_c0_g1_i1.p1 TRINITY_DN13029_c0_g1~~TRINITY_DN13029_c0_g1_i1.p1  ORF type:complete len:203 (+),score=29.75 TRINITY_DN13029_c0_g1_i1:143-751(+)